MSAGIGVFLRLASPSGGRLHAPGSLWLLAGLATAGTVLAALAVAFGPGSHPGASRDRRAAVLGAATGISWGFLAAVIKELSSRTSAAAPAPSCPPGRCTCSWPPGRRPSCWPRMRWRPGHWPPAQPGFTILDPLTASLLGVFLFGDNIRTRAADLAGEALALAVVIAGSAALSRSDLLAAQNGHPRGAHLPAHSSATSRPRPPARQRIPTTRP